ncbi:DUF3592 domain-containing protein [Actinacidiphila glaucinigra]|uniref:DUF3592 domain-containing protein n=1 Tax=Actinacidiphila glaucinigra TaxID=235986 RepID=UPI002DDA86D1|nr:DUF3592 domain-containing protein [Actinacidiphila glaucinigra]WSD60504.1 DUF3592 domain-containing protein [Actinacidiphila glaucinigra]
MHAFTLLMAACLFVLGLILVRLTAMEVLRRRAVSRNGVAVEGECVDRTWSQPGRPHYVLIYTTLEGRTFRAAFSSTALPPGFTGESTATIIYDPADPGTSMTALALHKAIWRSPGDVYAALGGAALCCIAAWMAMESM